MASIKGERSTRLTSWTAQAERQVRLQGDMNYRGTSSACAAGLIPTCSLYIPSTCLSVTRRRPASSSSVEVPTSPAFSPPIPPSLCLTPRSISSRFPLRRKSGAHRLEIGPLLLTYLFSEGTYVSIYDVSPLDGSPSAISIDSRPPLLASGAHSIGFRMVVCCLCIDLT